MQKSYKLIEVQYTTLVLPLHYDDVILPTALFTYMD